MRAASPLPVTPLSVHIQRALLKPLPERCKDLTQILRETSHKDLNTLFPQLVEHIYGFGHQAGWGMLTISPNQKYQDFESVYEFLAPDGPLLSMTYRLLGDGHTRYEFPVSCLPESSQCLLQEGDIPWLYTNKVPYSGPGRPVAHVLLNPFEYYIFHFAYSILNPNHPKGGPFSLPDGLSNCLYHHLLELYLSYFLPLNSTPALPVISQPNFRAPTYASSLPASFPGGHHQLSCLLGSPSSSRLSSVGGILKRSPSFSLPSSSPMATTNVGAQEELWRSEFLVLALSEFWLAISPGSETSSINTVFQQRTFVPSSLHIQFVRQFIKHLHSFSNSAPRNEVLMDASSSSHQSPLDIFKSQVIPQVVQKKLYTFLRLTFERWTLDASFRLPLETWLSYVQPWRYVNTTVNSRNLSEKLPDSVGVEWQTFITENLLFYSVLFKQLIPRFFRMELNSPKNSFLLFRVVKVFSQKNLQTMISEAEGLLEKTCSSQVLNSSQFLSPTAVNHLRQFVVETEGYNYQYVPIFGHETRDMIKRLLKLITSAREMAALHTLELKKNEPGWLSSTFGWLSGQEECQGGLTMAESQRVTQHLDMVLNWLCQMFQLPVPHFEMPHDFPRLENDSNSSFDQSPSKRWDFKDQFRPVSFREVHYKGNPDLQPIRSFEVAFLVRLLNHLSTTFNMKYQNEINGLYNRSDWVGRMSRQFFMPPVIFQEKGHDVSLPPRLCFRTLAHKKLLAYLFLFYVLCCVVKGYSVFSFTLLLMFLLLIYTFVNAVIAKRRGLV